MVWDPVLAREPAVNLRVDVPVPVMDVGVKDAVTPEGKLLTDKATAEVKPPETVLVTVVVLELLLVTVTVVGEALREKLAPAPAVTVSETVVEITRLPLVPDTVMGYVPVGAVEATVRVRVEVPLPGAAMGLGLKPAVTPVGKPEADNVIAPLKPFTAAVVMVDIPALPWTTETEVGEAETVKVGAVTTNVTVVEFVVVPVGVSVPVTVIG
jgi:hypothetical protein